MSHLVSDGAKGISAGVKESKLAIPLRLDLFHLLRGCVKIVGNFAFSTATPNLPLRREGDQKPASGEGGDHLVPTLCRASPALAVPKCGRVIEEARLSP